MTRNERYNKIIEARANILTALGLGAIIAGGFSALRNGDVFMFLGFFVFGAMLLILSQTLLTSLRIEEDDT